MTGEAQLFERFGRECPEGTVLFREGDAGKTMFVIQSGRVTITKSLHGASKTLAIMGPGEFLGEMSILNDKPRTATAEVTEDAQLLEIDGHTFEQMVVGNAEIAVRLIKRLARRLDAANDLIEVMMQRDPKARFILGLARQARVHGESNADGTIDVPLSTTDLAAELGLDTVEVEEILRRLNRLGIVERASDSLVINDEQRLHDFYEFLEEQDKRVRES